MSRRLIAGRPGSSARRTWYTSAVSSSIRACLPRTGLFTTVEPVRSATMRVVPIPTVLLIIVNVGFEMFDIPCSFANEVFDLEWIADMKDVSLFHRSGPVRYPHR